MDVATTESVDRLLGIADQHQPAIGKQRAEDRPLACVGVLEFIDERQRELCAHLRDQRGGVQRVGHRSVHGADQVVVIAQVEGLLVRGIQRARLRAQRMQVLQSARFLPGLASRQRIDEASERREQRRLRGAPGAGFAGARQQCFGAVFA